MKDTIDSAIFSGQVLEALISLCKKYKVRNLALFGSSVRGEFNPRTRDIDILVVFEKMIPKEHMQNYFGLNEDLERLFNRKVDLVEMASIKNPYILESIRKTRVDLYATA